MGGGGSVADLIYPVGAIYLSTSSTSPKTLFGGTWQRIYDRFLLCAGTIFSAGSTGGEADHKLTVEEMPSHSHEIEDIVVSEAERYTVQYIQTYCRSTMRSLTTAASGGDQPHNNMPPYLAVYAWKRTA